VLRRLIIVTAILLVLSVWFGMHAKAESAEEARLVEIGRRMYHEGVLADGGSAEATVAGDVTFESTQFTCVSCHRRSGLGSTEGPLTAIPITAEALYQPLDAGPRKRPGFTDESLAAAIRSGKDLTGQPFDTAMPAYDIPDLEMTGLLAYLKTLSTERSAGVSDEAVHFATVVSDGVDATAMLTVLEQYFKDKQVDTRNQGRRSRVGTYYRRQFDQAYRVWELHVWRLHGSPDTWPQQLERYYEEYPVFALISGQVAGSWEPIHNFCESRGIPSILPNTDAPSLEGNDWYTLYYSAGNDLVARVGISDMVQQQAVGKVLQVYRSDEDGILASRAFRSAFEGNSGWSVADFEISPKADLKPSKLLKVARKTGADVVMLWLSEDGLGAGEWVGELDQSYRLYLATSTFDGDLSRIPAAYRQRAKLIHPFTMPAERKTADQRTSVWLRKTGIEYSDPRIMSQTWFACLVAGEGLMHVRFNDFYRDFFMESIEHTTERIQPFSAQYPTPSFGPDQRFLSKGAYIIDPSSADDGDAPLTAHWIVP
jgi:hypothetical protein